MIIMSSLAGINFFAVVKSFDANISISANFVLTVKNSNLENNHHMESSIYNMITSFSSMQGFSESQ